MDNAPAAKADFKATHVAVDWKHGSPLTACRFDPRGRFVFAAAEDRAVHRFELASGTKVTLTGHESWVRGIGFLPDGETLITGGYDGRLIWWPCAADAPAPVRTIEAHDGWIRDVSVNPDGALVATGGNDNLVKLWDTSDGRLVRTLSGHGSRVYSTLFHPRGQWLLSGDLKGQVHQWEVATGKQLRTFDSKVLHSYNKGQGVDYGGVRSMSLSPDGRHLACAGLHKATNPLGAVNEPLITVFDWETGELKRSLEAKDVKGIAWRVVYHPEGFLIAGSGGSGGGFIIFWQSDNDAEAFKLKLPNTARDLDLHPDGLQVATIHHDGHVRISRMAAKAAA